MYAEHTVLSKQNINKIQIKLNEKYYEKNIYVLH